jgi:hypothetical protein
MVGSLIVKAVTGVALNLFTAGMTAAAFAINFAVSMIVTRIFADNPERQQDMGVRQQVPPSAVNAIPVVYGDAYMGGTFVDAVLSENQKAMYYVLAISSISPDGQFTFDTTDMYYGDRRIVFDSTDPAKVVKLIDEAENEDTKINGYLWIGLYTSTQAGAISSSNGWFAPNVVMGPTTPFTAYPIAPAQQWPSSGRQMNGTAFAIVTLIYSRDAETTQLSPITFKVKQALNGTGVAKPGDVWYDYITNSVYGGAVDPAFVDSTSRTALNAYSDALITFENSSGVPSTQSRYRINGVLDAGETVLSNIDRIMSACDSWMTYNAALGQWSVVVNKAETASYAFTDNNIIGDIRVSATDITSSINQVEARFPFKENRDQANFINIETPSGLLYPNEPVNKYSITYDLVNDSVQAHYLANRLLEQAREDLIVSFNTTYFGIQVDAGNVVSVTNSNYGWNAKLFRVMKVNEASLPDGSLGARLELSEYNVQVYDDQTIRQFSPVPNSGLPNVGYFSGLTAPTVTGFPTVSVPYFNVVVSIPATGRVTFVDLYYSTTPTPTASDLKLLSTATSSDSQPFTNSSSFTFGNQILPSGTYYFGYVVGNEIGQTQISPLSASFTWTPTGTVGPFVDISGITTFSKTSSNVYTPATATLNAVTQRITSPTYAWAITGATPTTGSSSSITITPNAASTSIVAQLTVNGTNLSAPIVKSVTMGIIVQATDGATGPRNAQVFFYYNAAQATAPTAPTTAQVAYNFSTQVATISAAGWSALFNPSGLDTVTADNKYWAVKVVFQENTFGGTYSETISSVFTWQNLDGLVTFTNLATAEGPLGTGATFIDGGSIITESLSANRISSGNMINGSSSNAWIQMGQTGTVIATLKSSLNVRKVVADTTLVNIAAQNNLDGNVTIWGHSANNAVGSGNGSTGTHTTQNTFDSWQRLGALGSGLTNSGVWGLAYADNVNSKAGVFERYSGTNSGNIGSLNKSIQLATASYCAFSPSGQGKIYIVDGNGPFTGFHEGMFAIDDTIEVGDIVTDVSVFYRANISNVLFNVARSTTATQPRVLGVVSNVVPVETDTPGILWEPVESYTEGDLGPVTTMELIPGYDLEELQTTYKVVQVNAVGEGQINVCGEAGDIQAGDFIVTSSTPGKGMKQSDDIMRSITVAKARESVTFSDPSEVKMIACIYLGG